MKGEMESMFKAFGFEMDLDDLHYKMKPEELMQKAMEMEEDILQQANEKETKQANEKKSKAADRKKTEKQLEREEKAKQAEEARTKNISSIYKQLAKIFHPDLEHNEELKLQKEELMKQLTNAYENNDLHTLLKLELVWIQNEENNPGKLTDEELAIYNRALKEQILELEDEIHAVVTHPRYQPLKEFAKHPSLLKYLNIGNIKKQIESMGAIMTSNLAKLKGNEKQAVSTVKKIIHDFEVEGARNMDFPNDDFYY